jgi:hypothetical protein
MKNESKKRANSTKSTPMSSLQRAPSKAERESMRKNPKKYCAEAIAMRRIVVEQGRWLSPFMKDAPLPVLTEWERTVDLSKLEPWKNYDPKTGRLLDSRDRS